MRCINVVVLMLVSLLAGCATQPIEPSVPPSSSVPAVSETATAETNVNDAFRASQQVWPDQVKNRYTKALKLKSNGDGEAAERELQTLVADYPNLSMAWLQLGDLAMTAREHAAAEQDYLAAINANTHNYYARNRLAQLLRHQGRFREALQHYDAALASYADFAAAILNRAILKDLYLGDKSGALADYLRYQQLVPQAEQNLAGWITDIQRQLQNEGQ